MRLKPLSQHFVAGKTIGKLVRVLVCFAGMVACYFVMGLTVTHAAEVGTITINAIVPENPIYNHAVSKNSSVKHNAYDIDQGLDLVLTLTILGPYDMPLKNRKICVFVVGPNEASSGRVCGLSDMFGTLRIRPFTSTVPARGEYAVVTKIEGGSSQVFIDKILRFTLGDNPAGQEYPNTPSQAEHHTYKNIIQEQKTEQTEKWWVGLEFGTLNTVDQHIHAHTTITPKNAAMDPPARTRDGPFGDSSSPPGCGCRHQPPNQLPG